MSLIKTGARVEQLDLVSWTPINVPCVCVCVCVSQTLGVGSGRPTYFLFSFGLIQTIFNYFRFCTDLSLFFLWVGFHCFYGY